MKYQCGGQGSVLQTPADSGRLEGSHSLSKVARNEPRRYTTQTTSLFLVPFPHCEEHCHKIVNYKAEFGWSVKQNYDFIHGEH